LYCTSYLKKEKKIVFLFCHFHQFIDFFFGLQTLPGPVTDPSQLPKWNYDGSSTGQAPGEDSEVII
jgi:hypothetical protein